MRGSRRPGSLVSGLERVTWDLIACENALPRFKVEAMNTPCISVGIDEAQPGDNGERSPVMELIGEDRCSVLASMWLTVTRGDPSVFAKFPGERVIAFHADLRAWASSGLDSTRNDWLRRAASYSDSEFEAVFRCVVFDLNKDEEHYNRLWEALQSCAADAYCRIHSRCWFIQSVADPSDIRDMLSPHLERGDRLVVFPARASGAWMRVTKDVRRWLTTAAEYEASMYGLQFAKSMMRAQFEMDVRSRATQNANEIVQMISDTTSSIAATSNQVRAQNQKMQHESSVRWIRAIGGACVECGAVRGHRTGCPRFYG